MTTTESIRPIQTAGSYPAGASAYRGGQIDQLPVSLDMDANLPSGTEPCNAYSIQGSLNSATGEEFTARDVVERLFLNEGAPYRTAILDRSDQKLTEADKAALTRPENLAAYAKAIRDHNGGALMSGQINLKYALYLYTCYQQKVEQGMIRENPNENILSMYIKFFTHGPQGKRPPIKVPVRELAKLINEPPKAGTAAPTKPAPAKPVIVDKPGAKPAAPANQPAAAPFMPF